MARADAATRVGPHAARRRPTLAPSRLAVALALLVPAVAGAARIDYELGMAVLHSDNIGLTETAPVDETVLSPSLRFHASDASSTFRLDARGDVQYLHYLDGTFDDGFRGSLTGQAGWTVVEERVELVVEDYLSRQPIDALAAFSPGNEQEANVFVAGPTFFARFGATARGQLDLRYGNSRAEDTPEFDGDRYSAALRLLRDFSRTRRLGINVEATRVDYDLAALGADYTRYDGYLSYAAELRNIDVRADAGYSRLDLEDRPGSHADPLFRARLTWRPSPRSSLEAGASHAFADAAQDLATLTAGAGNPQVPLDANVYRQRRVDGGYRYAGERVDLAIGPYYQRIDYVDAVATEGDQDSYGGSVDLGYRLRPRLRLSLLAAHDTRDYDDLSRRDRELVVVIGLTSEFTRHWSARFDLLRRQRDSSAPGQDYDENAAAISVRYRR